jgi:hypothetical protein
MGRTIYMKMVAVRGSPLRAPHPYFTDYLLVRTFLNLQHRNDIEQHVGVLQCLLLNILI